MSTACEIQKKWPLVKAVVGHKLAFLLQPILEFLILTIHLQKPEKERREGQNDVRAVFVSGSLDMKYYENLIYWNQK